jgi:tetratricopeptide (TPR) repeat protein
MRRLNPVISGLLCGLLAAACAAGEPQTSAEQDEAALFLWSLNTTSQEARQHVADGMREWDMERGPEAYEHFQRAIAADPDLALAHLFAAGSAQSQQDVRAHLDHAVERAQGAGEVGRLIIEIVRKNVENDAEGALEAARRLVEIDGDNPRSWILLADMHNALAHREEAREAVDRALELQPGFAFAHMWLAWSYSVFEPLDLAQAEAHARHAVELAPNEVTPHDYLGDALRQQGRLEEAAQAYTAGAELDPTNALMIQQRGHVNTFLGRFAEARADYDAAAALEPHGNRKATFLVYSPLVNVYEGRPAPAISELEAVYAAVDGMGIPDPVAVKTFVTVQQFEIARHHRMLPEARAAAARLTELNQQRIAAIGTDDVRRIAEGFIALDAGRVAALAGDYALARQKAAEFVRIREPERNPNRNQPAHELLGTVALMQERYEDALREFDLSDPNNTRVAYQRGLALEALGRTAEAREAYERVSQTYLNNIEVAVTRGDALRKLQTLAGS